MNPIEIKQEVTEDGSIRFTTTATVPALSVDALRRFINEYAQRHDDRFTAASALYALTVDGWRRPNPADVADEFADYYDRPFKASAITVNRTNELLRKDEECPADLTGNYGIAYRFSQYGKLELRENEAGQFRSKSHDRQAECGSPIRLRPDEPTA